MDLNLPPDQWAQQMEQRMAAARRDFPPPKSVHPAFWNMLQMMAAQPVPCLARTCLELGKAWGADRVVVPADRGEPRLCFKNAGERAVASPELTYVEGLACTSGLGMAVHHAWLVDAQGRVVEPTWKDGHSYCGLPIKHEMLARVLLETEVWGLFGGTRLPDWFAEDIKGMLADVQGHPPRAENTVCA